MPVGYQARNSCRELQIKLSFSFDRPNRFVDNGQAFIASRHNLTAAYWAVQMQLLWRRETTVSPTCFQYWLQHRIRDHQALQNGSTATDVLESFGTLKAKKRDSKPEPVRKVRRTKQVVLRPQDFPRSFQEGAFARGRLASRPGAFRSRFGAWYLNCSAFRKPVHSSGSRFPCDAGQFPRVNERIAQFLDPILSIRTIRDIALPMCGFSRADSRHKSGANMTFAPVAARGDRPLAQKPVSPSDSVKLAHKCATHLDTAPAV